MKKDPDRVQSESYNLENKALALGNPEAEALRVGERDVQDFSESLGTGNLYPPLKGDSVPDKSKKD